MNLHGIVTPAISVVNPPDVANIAVSAGSTTNADFSRTPNYDWLMNIPAQVQSLTYKDLVQLDGVNMNGVKRAIYLTGRFDGVVRPLLKGGDMVLIIGGVNQGTWLIAQTLEQWPDWCKVAVTLQNETPLTPAGGSL